MFRSQTYSNLGEFEPCLFHKWLDTNNNKTGNPIKLIFQVLNYAQKNKCPRLRSALTYIDEEHPSCLDFGRQKFGGPFTEEEVEDVKTIFGLTPLLVLVYNYAVIFFCKLGISHVDIAININALAFVWFQSKYVFIVYPDIASTNGVFQAIHASVQ